MQRRDEFAPVALSERLDLDVLAGEKLDPVQKLLRYPIIQVHSRSRKREATPYGKSQVAAPIA